MEDYERDQSENLSVESSLASNDSFSKVTPATQPDEKRRSSDVNNLVNQDPFTRLGHMQIGVSADDQEFEEVASPRPGCHAISYPCLQKTVLEMLKGLYFMSSSVLKVTHCVSDLLRGLYFMCVKIVKCDISVLDLLRGLYIGVASAIPTRPDYSDVVIIHDDVEIFPTLDQDSEVRFLSGCFKVHYSTLNVHMKATAFSQLAVDTL